MMPYRPPKKTAPEGEFRGRQGSGRGETACGGGKRHKAIFHDKNMAAEYVGNSTKNGDSVIFDWVKFL